MREAPPDTLVSVTRYRALSLVLLAFLSGCPDPQGPTPAPPTAASPTPEVATLPPVASEVVIPGEGITAAAWPPACGTVGLGAYVRQVYEGLTAFDENAKIVPALATSWRISDDLTTYAFVLEKGLTFHDGSPLDAAAVVKSFEDYARESGEWFWVVEPIAGARAFRDDAKSAGISGLKVVDPLTVEVRLERPDGIFLVHLAMPQLGIFKRTDAAPPFRAVGAGPYRQVAVDRGDVVLAPFAGYQGKRPSIERLRWKFTPSSDAELRMGAVHLIATTAPTVVGARVETYAGLVTTYASFAPDVPLEVRKLANRVLDRAAYCRDALGGLAEPSHGVIPPGMRAAHPTPRRFDEGDAPVLVKKYVLNAQVSDRLFFTLKEALAPHKVELVCDPTKPYQLEQHGWIADYPDPDDFLRVLFHSKSGSLNVARYANPEVDALLEKARAMSADLEDDARLELYRKIEDRIVADAPWLFLWHEKNRVAVHPRLKGLRLGPLDSGGFLTLAQTDLALGD
jgi:ABC-type transport system substrate-binding protein